MRIRRLLVSVLVLATASTTATADPAGATSWKPPQDVVGRILARMTLPQKVGQLFATYVYGGDATTPSAGDAASNRAAYGVSTPAEVIAKYNLGGVIYFTWSHNLDGARQIATLSNGLQTAATGSGAQIPLLVSTDQESGTILRMPMSATQFPGNMPLGAGRSLLDAFSAAQVTGRELRAVGIQQAFAPDADVNTNPENPVIGVRSFSDNPLLAATMVAAQVVGFQLGANTSAAAKHFPGHGAAATDSHTGLPVISRTRDEWNRIDAPPFRAAIAAGIDTIMTAHIVVPALDTSGDPATLSPTILTGVLRQQLGFDGVVVTDSLGMAAVRQKYGDDRVPVLALKAGADMMLMPPNLDVAYQAVLGAVAAGELTEARIDQSVRRILAVKQRRGVLDRPMVDVDAAVAEVGSAANQRVAQRVADKSVTLLRDEPDRLPLASDRSVLVTGWDSSTAHNVATLAGRMAARGARTAALPTGLPNDAKIAEAVAAAGNHDVTVVMTQKAWDSTTADPGRRQQKLVAALLATGRPVIVVAVREPYDIAHLPGVGTYLVTYTHTPASMESLASVLYGQSPARGRLPVDIRAADEESTLLYPYGFGLNR